jgi:hypothetical protein
MSLLRKQHISPKVLLLGHFRSIRGMGVLGNGSHVVAGFAHKSSPFPLAQ